MTRTAGGISESGSPSCRSDKIRLSPQAEKERKVGIMAEDSLTEIRDRMREFTKARDWEKFHDPKSLALALVGEVGELAELLQWLPADEVVERAQVDPLQSRLGEEISDVLIYLVRLADVCGVDLPTAVKSKMASSEERFPSSVFVGEAPIKS
jgi:dCTP diphosphatase